MVERHPDGDEAAEAMDSDRKGRGRWWCGAAGAGLLLVATEETRNLGHGVAVPLFDMSTGRWFPRWIGEEGASRWRQRRGISVG